MAPSSSHPPWMVSLHGGHSREFCAHAAGSLEAIVEAAIAAGYHTYGLSEHAPRYLQQHLFPEEVDQGWDCAKLAERFAAFAVRANELAARYRDRITLLPGIELEVVPHADYVRIANELRTQHPICYAVGSVHFVGDHVIDGPESWFEAAVRDLGSLEALAIAYYDSLAEMVHRVQPEVVGHFDLVRLNAPDEASVATPVIRAAAERALDRVAEAGAILDVNTAGYRKGLDRPYCAPWVVQAALERNIGFCFGDDSHCEAHVGFGLDRARQYLLDLGVTEVCYLADDEGHLGRACASLDEIGY